MNEIPPQAYTRETLMVAYEWFQRQPPNIQKLAATPDALVGLFLQYKRKNQSTLEQEAPVSAQLFKQDLKRLSAGLEVFSQTQVDEANFILPREQNSRGIYHAERQTSAASVAFPSRTAPSYGSGNFSKQNMSVPSGGRAEGMSNNNYYGNTAPQMNYQGPSGQAASSNSHGPANMGSFEQNGYSAYVPNGGSSAAVAFEPTTPNNYQVSAANAQAMTNGRQTYSEMLQPGRPQPQPSAVEKMQQARREFQSPPKNSNYQMPGVGQQHNNTMWNQLNGLPIQPPAASGNQGRFEQETSIQMQALLGLLDNKTQDIIRQVTEGLNLGSDKEALRLLISLGYRRLRPIMEEMAGTEF